MKNNMDIFELRRAFRHAQEVPELSFSDLVSVFGPELWDFLENLQELQGEPGPAPEKKKEQNESGNGALPTLRLSVLHDMAVRRALEVAKFVQKDAARMLGITPRSLNHYISQNKITHPNWKRNK